MRIQAARPEQYVVRVARGEPVTVPVSADGKVTFTVPGHRGCSTYLFGAIKIIDGSGEGERVVELRRGEQVVRKFSRRKIAGLATDEAGCRVVKVKD